MAGAAVASLVAASPEAAEAAEAAVPGSSAAFCLSGTALASRRRRSGSKFSHRRSHKCVRLGFTNNRLPASPSKQKLLRHLSCSRLWRLNAEQRRRTETQSRDAEQRRRTAVQNREAEQRHSSFSKQRGKRWNQQLPCFHLCNRSGLKEEKNWATHCQFSTYRME